MSAPLVVMLPHRLGKPEALRRLRSGLDGIKTGYGHLLSVDEAIWEGDRVKFRVRALGQSASGTIEVFDQDLRLEVTLPWLLAKLTERFVPAIKREGALLLERK
jgi:hypothetical protein